MQIASFSIWNRVAVFVSYDDFTTSAHFLNVCHRELAAGVPGYVLSNDISNT